MEAAGRQRQQPTGLLCQGDLHATICGRRHFALNGDLLQHQTEGVCMACCTITAMQASKSGQTLTPCALSRICSSASSACEGCTTHCRQYDQKSADSASHSILPGSGCRAAGLLQCWLAKQGWAGMCAATGCWRKAELWLLLGNIRLQPWAAMTAGPQHCCLATSRLGCYSAHWLPETLSCKVSHQHWQPGLALAARLQGSSGCHDAMSPCSSEDPRCLSCAECWPSSWLQPE